MDIEEMSIFCKKKGFIYPSSEIYGGVAGLYDYGHLGTKLKHNFENVWRKYFLALNDNFFEIETANIMHENVFKASGHLENFSDPVVNCLKCEFSERADLFVGTAVGKRVEELSKDELNNLIKKENLKCPKCSSKLAPVSDLNLMFPLRMGVGSKNKSYLRPETAQSPYVNFKLQYGLLRKKLPLGLAIIGRAYRNEISPRNLTLRQREFTQAELQIFFNPNKVKEHRYFDLVKDCKIRVMLVSDRDKEIQEKTAQELVDNGLPKFYVYHLVKIQQFYFETLKISPEKFRMYELNEKEKAFYNKYHFDLEINLKEHGWTEMGGLHYRTDHDLKGHQKVSGEKMEVLDEDSGARFIPHVLELSFGVDRHVYALLDLAHEDNKERGNIILHLPNKLTPYFCAVFPLVKNNPELLAKSEEVFEGLRKSYHCYFDAGGSVGRRYARADEIGVRYCITVDFDSLDDDAVTIRDRETIQQKRIKISELKEKLFELHQGLAQTQL